MGKTGLRWGKVIFIILFSSLLVSTSLLVKPVLTGDGREYLGMTISFKNHLTFDLTQEDISERFEVEKKNNINYPDDFTYHGYYKSVDEKYYSYHFWFYSMINAIPYVLFEKLNINTLKSFQFTNCILYILLIHKIIFRTKLSNKIKIILVLISLLSPIIFYLNWTHPEVFSYVFLFMGLLNLYESKYKKAMSFTSLASLQNPPISIVSLYILLSEFWKRRNKIFKDQRTFLSFLSLGLISLINICPYLFYWLHFREFSLISSSGYASLDLITFDKIWSLFFDLNFGLIIYVPVLLLAFFYAVFKKDKIAIVSCGILILVSIVSATQLNWNSGMMYINRYSVWLIPLLIFGLLNFFENISLRKNVLLLMIFILTTGSVSIVCLKEHDYSNYIKFGPVAQFIISNFPTLYNPNFEIFYERSQGYEGINRAEFPIEISNDNGIRKILVFDESSSLMGYINGDLQLASNNIFMVKDQKNDLISSPYKFGFRNGWYPLEKLGEDKHRWMEKESTTLFIANDTKYHRLKIVVTSFNIPRKCTISLNGDQIFEKTIPTGQFETIDIPISIKRGGNQLKIVSLDGTDKPSLINGTDDSRDLSFAIKSIIID
ncbi:hypothetical protein ABEV00_15205 [Paenibacillus thiaminolyticus]|uniref:hypothetical protein n=1 Tax=Paenibacillus thiaminolyticus TaxID=49283 RepID=UPI003D29CEFA